MFAAMLILIFFGALGFVLFRRPQLPVTVVLIVLAGVAAAVFAAYFIPNKLSERAKRGVSVGVAAVGVMTTLLAPIISGGVTGGTQQSPSPTQGEQLPSALSREAPAEPLTAILNFGGDCENFAMPTGALAAVPTGPDLNAKWAYQHGGATTNKVLGLTVQGTSDAPVFIDHLRIVNLETKIPPSKLANLLPCGRPRLQVVPKRYFVVNLGDPPQIVASPAPDADPQTGETEPAVNFPFEVSEKKVEYFLLVVTGPACFCEWQIELGWSSSGRNGKMILDHGFGKVRSDTSVEPARPEHERRSNGTWRPPLPK